MIKEIITTSYSLLKKSKPGDFDEIKNELEMLGIDFDNKSISLAYELVQSSDSMKKALDNLSENERNNSLDSVLEKVSAKIKNEDVKKQKAAENKKKKADAKKAAALRKKEAEDFADLNNPYLRIVDYKIVREKMIYNLEAAVKKEMKKGWVPYGGAGAAAFGISPVGGNSLFQAMVKFK